jgi:hypothetical protein
MGDLDLGEDELGEPADDDGEERKTSSKSKGKKKAKDSSDEDL